MAQLPASLIATVREAPDDDDPRLVCADWLEEHGDLPRAEFIRLQIQRANLPDDDPRQSELFARELRMLKRYSRQWTASHFVFKKCRFRRGFIEYVHLHMNHFLHHRRQMFDLEPVREVSLTGWMRATDSLVHRVAACEELRHIEILRIHTQGPHKHPRSHLVDLLESPHWQRLRAFHCDSMVEFDNATRQRFERLPVLAQLEALGLPYLDRWTVSPPPDEWFSDGVDHLRWMNLRKIEAPYPPSNEHYGQMQTAPFWNRLQDVELYVTPDDALDEPLPETLRKVTLSQGSLPRSRVPAWGRFFQRLADHPLTSFTLLEPESGPEHYACLFESSSRSTLKELELTRTFTREHALMLERAPKADCLRVLTLNWIQFDDDAAEVLFSADRLSGLRKLDLSRCEFSKAAWAALASSPWRSIEELDLSDTKFGTEQLLALLGGPVAQNLNRLRLPRYEQQGETFFPAILSNVMQKILELPNLVCLTVQAEDCSDDAIALLRQSETLAWYGLDREADESATWLPHDAICVPELRRNR